MKKTLILLVFSLIIMVSGCARVDEVPVDVEPKDVCVTCHEEENKKPQIPCVYEAKVVNYSSKCDCSYEFPVTVRKISSCKGGSL